MTKTTKRAKRPAKEAPDGKPEEAAASEEARSLIKVKMTKVPAGRKAAPPQLPLIDPDVAAEAEGGRQTVPIIDCDHGPFQVRDPLFGIADLVASIKQDGLLQPITVRRLPPVQGIHRLEIIAGHRRYEACKAIGLVHIAAQVLKVDDEAAYRLSLIENMKRVDLDPLQEAETYALAVKKLGWTVGQLAKATNRTERYIKQRLAILNLPSTLRQFVQSGLPPAKAALLVPLDQFQHIKRGGANLIGKLKLDELLETTNDAIARHVHDTARTYSTTIGKDWDSDICRKAGCLGIVDGKKVCLSKTHAMAIKVEKLGGRIDKMLQAALADDGTLRKAGLSEDHGLPIFYDLEHLQDPYYQAPRVKTPGAYPAPPLRFSSSDAYRSEAEKLSKAARWNALKDLVKGKAFAANCRECPAWTKGCKRGRGIVMEVEPRYSGEDLIKATLACLVPECRRERYGESQKERGETADPKAIAKAKVEAAVQPYLTKHTGELLDLLAGEKLRILAVQFIYRYRMGEMPTMQHKHREILEGLGVTMPEHDNTPNGFLKAVMALGEETLWRALAGHALQHFDNAVQGRGGWGDEEAHDHYSAKPLQATVGLLFGEKAGTVIKDEVKRLTKNAKAVEADAVKALTRNRRPKKTAAKEAK